MSARAESACAGQSAILHRPSETCLLNTQLLDTVSASSAMGWAASGRATHRSMQRSLRAERMFVDPVPRDVHPSAHPHPVVLLDVVEEALKRSEPSRSAEQPAVHADRKHLRSIFALGVERVEAVLQVGKELLARVEALR